jgi:LuxR family maltose regulon positive regulatory protein
MRFWGYVALALEQVYPGIGAPTLRTLANAHAASLEAVVSVLIHTMLTQPHPCYLVLDDYHHITDVRIHHLMVQWLEHLPATMHVILSTRTDPPFPLGRFRVRRILAEIRADDLRFSASEIALFFADVPDIALTEQDMGCVTTCTEGWVAGLQLIALALRQPAHKDTAALLHTFACGRHRALIEYLGKEVLRDLPPEQRAFLLHTSILW